MRRKAIHSFVSDEAWDGWHDFADENLVSISGIVEAIGRRMNLGESPADIDTAQLLKEARQIDHERRSRKDRAVPA